MTAKWEKERNDYKLTCKDINFGLSVLGRPSIQLYSESASFVFAGERHSISCVAVGWPLPTVRWLKNNQELNNDEINQTIVVKKSIQWEELVILTLRILEVDLHDSGNYTCEATNNITTVGRSITISVSCKNFSNSVRLL